MKRKYESPRMVVEQFEANEYIAACHDTDQVYKFTCDGGYKEVGFWGSQDDFHVYLNGADGLPRTSDDIDWSRRNGYLQPYHPCGTTHEAKTTDEFPAGYMYKLNSFGQNTGDPINVIVWTEGGTNTHCTQNLIKDQWEIAKS